MSKASPRHHEISPGMAFLHSEPKRGEAPGLQVGYCIWSPSRIRLGSRRGRRFLRSRLTEPRFCGSVRTCHPPSAHPAPRVYSPAWYLFLLLKWSREWSAAWVGCTKTTVAHHTIQASETLHDFPDCRSFGTDINHFGHLGRERTSSMAMHAMHYSWRYRACHVANSRLITLIFSLHERFTYTSPQGQGVS